VSATSTSADTRYTPTVGQDVEVVIRGTVTRFAALGKAVEVQMVDGTRRWFTAPDLTGAVQWNHR